MTFWEIIDANYEGIEYVQMAARAKLILLTTRPEMLLPASAEGETKNAGASPWERSEQ